VFFTHKLMDRIMERNQIKSFNFIHSNRLRSRVKESMCVNCYKGLDTERTVIVEKRWKCFWDGNYKKRSIWLISYRSKELIYLSRL